MSGFLLDTNIPSELTRSQPDARVIRWLESVSESDLFLSVVSLGEMRRGCSLLQAGKRRDRLEQWIENDVRIWFAKRILPINASVAERWGELDAQRQLAGKPLNTADGLIAATALEHGLILVTRNVADFIHLGVSVFDPWA